MLQNDSPLEILIAEDMEDAVLILLSQLKKFDCTAKVVGTGLQAVDGAPEKITTSFLWTSECREWTVFKLQNTFYIIVRTDKKPYITAMTSQTIRRLFLALFPVLFQI